MNWTEIKIAIAFGLCAASLLNLHGRASDATTADREGHWRQDIDYFAREFPARQKDCFKLVPKDKFEQEIAGLRSELPQSSDVDLAFDLKRIVAGLGVAHTDINIMSGLGPQMIHQYPLRTQWFSDGLAVVAVASEYRAALGARVVKIGDVTPEEALARLSSYISHENEAWLRHQSPTFLMLAELMQKEKIAGSNGHLAFTLAKPDGEVLMLDVAPENSHGYKGWVNAAGALHFPPVLSRKHPQSFYWWEYLTNSQILYLQYNKCADAPKQPFADWARAFFAFADSNSVRRLVVDLRMNSGGNSEVINPLLRGIAARSSLNAPGRLFVLIGSATFSSGEMAAEEFHNSFQPLGRLHFNATLVGLPTGGKPNGYGEVKSLTLPNAKLDVYYTVKYFRMCRDSDPPSLEPDLPVSATIADFLAGRDPTLETALTRGLVTAKK